MRSAQFRTGSMCSLIAWRSRTGREGTQTMRYCRLRKVRMSWPYSGARFEPCAIERATSSRTVMPDYGNPSNGPWPGVGFGCRHGRDRPTGIPYLQKRWKFGPHWRRHIFRAIWMSSEWYSPTRFVIGSGRTLGSSLSVERPAVSAARDNGTATGCSYISSGRIEPVEVICKRESRVWQRSTRGTLPSLDSAP